MELVPEQTQQGTSHEVSDFIHCVQQKKEVIQYPRLTKLIIADIMSMFESIYKRLEEEYHAIKDDTPLVSVYTTRKVIVKGMLIPDNLITNVIRDTQEYKDYVEKYGGVDVPMIQSQSVEFTQGTHRTPRATRTPNPTDVVQKKSKGTPAVGETSSPMKSLKIRVRQQKLVFTIPLPPSDDQERYDIHEATLLSLALHKTAKNAEEQENMATVKEKQLEDDVEKIIEEDRAKSHKESPKEIEDDKEENKDDKKDDDDNDDHDDHTLIKTQRTGNSKTMTDKVQTPIPSPLRSPRTNLSSNKMATWVGWLWWWMCDDEDGWGGVAAVVQMMVEMVMVGVDVGGGDGDWRGMVAWCSVKIGQRWWGCGDHTVYDLGWLFGTMKLVVELNFISQNGATAPNSIHYVGRYNKMPSILILRVMLKSVHFTFSILSIERKIAAWLSVNQSIQIMTSKLPSPMGIKAMLKGVSKGSRCNLIAWILRKATNMIFP
nr:hypothetical protein [Tanacetum cinerariifolium]